MSRNTRRADGLWNLWGLFWGCRRQPRAQQIRRLKIEPLERRALLTVTFSGTVYVRGVLADDGFATAAQFPNGSEMVAVPNVVVRIDVQTTDPNTLQPVSQHLIGITGSSGAFSVTGNADATRGGKIISATVQCGNSAQTPYYVVAPSGTTPYQVPFNSTLTAKGISAGNANYTNSQFDVFIGSQCLGVVAAPFTKAAATEYSTYGVAPLNLLPVVNAFRVQSALYAFYDFATNATYGLGAPLPTTPNAAHPALRIVYPNTVFPGDYFAEPRATQDNVAVPTIYLTSVVGTTLVPVSRRNSNRPSSDPQAIGHEFGHYVAWAASFFGQVPGRAHSPGYNARYFGTDRHGDYGAANLHTLDYWDQELAFCEGWADFYCVAAVSVESAYCKKLDWPGILAAGSGWYSTQGDLPTTATWNLAQLGYAQGTINSAGEDDEAAVSRVLWALATNPKYEAYTYQVQPNPALKYKNQYQAVYQLIRSGQPLFSPSATPLGAVLTLNELWTVLAFRGASPTNQAYVIKTFGGLFQANDVTPVLTQIQGAQFVFKVPLLYNNPNTMTPAPGSSAVAFNDQIRAFDQVRLTFYSVVWQIRISPGAK